MMSSMRWLNIGMPDDGFGAKMAGRDSAHAFGDRFPENDTKLQWCQEK
jgi:hypothetical protein